MPGNSKQIQIIPKNGLQINTESKIKISKPNDRPNSFSSPKTQEHHTKTSYTLLKQHIANHLVR